MDPAAPPVDRFPVAGAVASGLALVRLMDQAVGGALLHAPPPALLKCWHGITTELRNAFSTSSDAFLRSKHIIYSTTAAVQGRVILPLPVKPNSSSAILNSSGKAVELRYANGISNLLPSAVYTLTNAITTSSDASLLSKHITYSIMAASQGNVILPSSPANPNSSCDMLRSTPKIAVPRYASGTSNRLPSAEYTTQWPLLATDEVLHDDPSASFAGRQGLAMELRNALSTSLETSLLSRSITYSIAAASQGSVILPPSPANPNSSCDMLRSSLKTVVLRYTTGTSNRLPSAEYTTAKRIAHLAKKWRRTAVMGRKRLTWGMAKEVDERCASVAGKGHCAMYTSDGRRFDVPLAYLGTPIFSELLWMSQEEFGFRGQWTDHASL
ncbi:hypothetical protein U9M48_015073 [Paspalum notatum var. saurae]|uniref:Uncharacterized protein n=1 Tax=Paspalum notatum var. saurae TaxID=547442 RepID=A0AAQ3T2S9_PASNO